MTFPTSVEAELSRIDDAIVYLQSRRAAVVAKSAEVSKDSEPSEVEVEEKQDDKSGGNGVELVVRALQMYSTQSSEGLQKLTGLNKEATTKALKQLIASGTVVSEGKKRGTKYSLSFAGCNCSTVMEEAPAAVPEADPVENPKRGHIFNMKAVVATILQHVDQVPRDSEHLQQVTGLPKVQLWRGLKSLVETGQVSKIGTTRATRYSLTVC